jgi:hypothetical protein
MKKIVPITMFFISIVVSAQKGELIISKWNRSSDAGFVVSPADYSSLKNGNINYSISNSNEFISLFLKITDPAVRNIILKEGLTLWINMDNKPARKMGVRFPVGSQFSEVGNKKGNSNPVANSVESPGTLLSMANTIELIGFINENMRRFPAENPDSFRGSVIIDEEGVLYYRLAMPIEKLPIRNSKSGKGSSPFTFGIEYGASTVTTDPHSNQVKSGSQSKSKPVIHWIKNVILATGM